MSDDFSLFNYLWNNIFYSIYVDADLLLTLARYLVFVDKPNNTLQFLKSATTRKVWASLEDLDA